MVARALVVVLSTLSALHRASMVFRASRLGARRLLTADAAAPTPSPRSRCWEGGGFEPWANGAQALPHSECWCEVELSACCAAAASSSAFSCWRTRRSSEIAGSGQPRSSMAAVARFWDARQESGGASASALASTFAPSLAHRLLSCAGPRAGGVVHGSAPDRQPDGARVGRHSPRGAPPHRNILCRASIERLGIHAKLLV
jgi:hypothetical protein